MKQTYKYNITLRGFEFSSSESNICTIHVMLRALDTFFCVSNANDFGYTYKWLK